MECMIDIETLGTKVTAPVKSIGAVFFDLETGELHQTFYRELELTSQFKNGRTPDEGAIKFWMNQSDEARKVFGTLKEVSALSLTVLNEFSWWFTNHPTAFVWGNGSSFDISIMESLFETFNLPCPWSYKQIMDYRTFKRFCYKDVDVDRSGGIEHHALDDAIAQANFVIGNYKKR